MGVVQKTIFSDILFYLFLTFILPFFFFFFFKKKEYEKPGDKYYAVPRAMGITRILPRTHGLSTSELIRRVCEYNEAKLREEGKLG